jgi:hypothetical protein
MRKALLVVGLAALAGCAGSKEASKPVMVSDSDYGRVPPAQTAVVDEARTGMFQARDELARAKLRQTEAAQATNLAQADISVAEAELQRAAARMKMAQESNDPTQLAQARDMNEAAQLRLNTAKARSDYAQKLQAARAQEVAAAEKQIALQEMRVEQAKLQALQQAQVPAAGKYDGQALDARVAAVSKEFNEASSNARTALDSAMNAERHWQELQRQLQARANDPAPRG